MRVPIRPTLLLGLAGLAIAALGWALEPREFFGAWLAALTILSGSALAASRWCW